MKRLIGLIAVLLLALPVAATAQNGKGGQPIYQVSGGGQVIAEANLQGPGDTIAFTAQLLDSADARGQLQVVNRSGGRGQDQQIFHGRVPCVEPAGEQAARFGGEGVDRRTGEPTEFVVEVTDADEQGNDVIVFRQLRETDYDDEDGPCDFEDQDTDLRETRLARGNVKIHDRR
jgi:hypothetical protein